jgi:hypothetical protein
MMARLAKQEYNMNAIRVIPLTRSKRSPKFKQLLADYKPVSFKSNKGDISFIQSATGEYF